MNLIPIRKDKRIVDGIEQEIFVIPAMTIGASGNTTKKVPHPLGGDFIAFNTIEEAQAVVARSGYDYVLPNTAKSQIRTTYTGDYTTAIYEALTKLVKDNSPSVSAAAISTLGEIGNTKSLELYLEKIGEDNDGNN